MRVNTPYCTKLFFTGVLRASEKVYAIFLVVKFTSKGWIQADFGVCFALLVAELLQISCPISLLSQACITMYITWLTFLS